VASSLSLTSRWSGRADKRAAQLPQTDLEEGKLRPALLLGKLPGDYDDWLICMISSQTRHYTPQFDEMIQDQDSDFAQSGLKSASVIRHGGSHDWYQNPRTKASQPVPRHREIN
jgi:hypothetical protein